MRKRRCFAGCEARREAIKPLAYDFFRILRSPLKRLVVPQGGGEFGGGAEACASEDVGDAPVEALDHAIGLRVAGRDQAVPGSQGLAARSKGRGGSARARPGR